MNVNVIKLWSREHINFINAELLIWQSVHILLVLDMFLVAVLHIFCCKYDKDKSLIFPFKLLFLKPVKMLQKVKYSFFQDYVSYKK